MKRMMKLSREDGLGVMETVVNGTTTHSLAFQDNLGQTQNFYVSTANLNFSNSFSPPNI